MSDGTQPVSINFHKTLIVLFFFIVSFSQVSRWRACGVHHGGCGDQRGRFCGVRTQNSTKIRTVDLVAYDACVITLVVEDHI